MHLAIDFLIFIVYSYINRVAQSMHWGPGRAN